MEVSCRFFFKSYRGERVIYYQSCLTVQDEAVRSEQWKNVPQGLMALPGTCLHQADRVASVADNDEPPRSNSMSVMAKAPDLEILKKNRHDSARANRSLEEP